MTNVVVIGASGQGKIAIDALEKAGEHRIVGWIDSFKPAGTVVYGYQVLGTENDLPLLLDRHQIYGGIIGIGVNEIRHQLLTKIRKLAPNFRFINAIHPSVQLARGTQVGEGVLMMAGAVVNSDSKVGSFSTLSTRASLDHDSTMGDFAYMAPNAATSGGVHIGDFCFIAVGASILHNVSVGEHSVVGAGSTVVKDLPAHVVAYGTPAKVIRKRVAGDKYL
jgi:sugar O-acyltransferase (sialic acid O-acetyltransferase NeuD family)